ncbi:hypothetical protein BKG71_00810 [Mycobacteroides chelonae]|jgi:hypothetical protein|nr:hypothetical protein [Mycobacteroides chelonae]OHT50324.1 hypothetical protein BKG63_20225 [Mycobacteroides chelonae]OHT93874.1 hypothetical protein BKG72_16555 [Mycobacteroides chelonae]OHU02052.1 hypothetical protein BKG71_00810 [Mycobacteroides chelonae]OLT90441.1 hypothetical protein BKG59_09705 [Mycobacteroides chelonae]
MPILRQLFSGAPLIDPVTTRAVSAGLARVLRENVLNSAIFDTQIAADLFWRGSKDTYMFADLGQVRPPYPKTFMEWEVPIGAVINGSPTPGLVGMRFGALLAEMDESYFRVACFQLRADGSVCCWPTYSVYQIHSDGTPLDRTIVYDKASLSEDYAWRSDGISESITTPAVLALGLINCKNVKTEESGRVTWRRSGRERRRGAAPNSVRYNTIVLPGGGSVREGRPGQQRMRASALHRVRGHFKTYTDSAPLLGKHVGTYWWGWQVRGDLDNGAVVSDYRLATS